MAGQNSDIANIVSKISSSGGVYGDYQELITDLAAINMPYANPQANILHNPIDTSYIAAARSDRLMANTPKTYSKKSIYGVVVGVVGGGPLVPFTGKTYYVDVPPFNKKFISHPDNFPYNDSEKLKDYEDLIFEYQGWDLLSGIGHKDIVEVQIPDNYPNHILTNKSDALILKRVCAAAVNPNTDTSKASESAPSGLKAVNEKPGLKYGAADIPYSWALTKIGKAPSNLAATELNAINAAKSNFDDVVKSKRMPQYDKLIYEYCRELGINPVLIKSIITIESLFKKQAKSRTGAGGLMQITSIAVKQAIKDGISKKFPGRTISVETVKQEDDLNIWAGINNFKFFFKKQGGDALKAAAAYNNGDSNDVKNRRDNSGVKNWDFNHITSEATIYIFKFNAVTKFMSEYLKLPIT